MKLVALNILAGGGDRWPRILSWLDAHNADVVVLSEWKDSPRSVAVTSWASSRAFTHKGVARGKTTNGVFVAAREPFSGVRLTPDSSSNGELFRATFADFELVAAYFPQLEAKAPFFATINDYALSANKPFLLIGDLNTGTNLADRTTGVRFKCERQFIDLRRLAGLTDLWRLSNGDEAREWTYLSKKKDGSNNHWRIDHAFGNAGFTASFKPRCTYDHAPRLERFSDHSAVILELTPLSHPETLAQI